jgi:dipeptidyl-peptidase 4
LASVSPMSYPRRSAVTRRFTLGAPRTPSVARDGGAVVFLRSTGPEDPVHSLWALDIEAGSERVLLDPRLAAAHDEGDLPAAERARRERARETGEGVVAYALDSAGERAVAAVGGRLLVVDVASGEVTPLDATVGAYDPRLAPDGSLVAYVVDGSVRVVGLDEPDRQIVSEDGVTWGTADFVAAEELNRTRGHWWSPDGRRLLAERVDESAVATWFIASPTEPWSEPRANRYPAAGTANARCSLSVFDLDGDRVDISWDVDEFPYLADVVWAADSPLLISVLTRAQRRLAVLEVDVTTGATSEVARLDDAAWVDVVRGTPAHHDGRVVLVGSDGDSNRVFVDGEPLSPPGLQVRSVVSVCGDGVLVTASEADPTAVFVARVGWDGSVEELTPADAVGGAVAGSDVLVATVADMDHDGATISVTAPGVEPISLVSHAEAPDVDLDVRFLELGDNGLRGALLLPSASGDGPLPVLLDPYGGPHAQRVLRQRGAFHASQWLADQGFAVLVVDGRGTPGRGPAWDRAVLGDLAGPVLDDQVEGLHAAAELEPRLDLSRVGIRGWSFGGYLAALAVLRRPDVFHAAVAGAPVTDWRLYDTAYTERYLGHPDEDPANYERTDLTPMAAGLSRPLMLIHGLADDNVVVAHTLQLSRALLEAGRAHTVLPLSGVTHMTPQEAVAENLLLLQVAFLKEHLRA